MIDIYICEDNLVFQNILVTEIEKYILIQQYDMKIRKGFESPETMLKELKDNTRRNIYFLDIGFKENEQNGLGLAMELRRKDPRGFIVFVTVHDELALDTFKYNIEALDYIIKDNRDSFRKRLNRVLDSIHNRIISEKNSDKSYFTIELHGEIRYVPVEDILYFKTSDNKHRINLYMENKVMEFYGNLNEIEGELNKKFFRVHRSYLVSLDKIINLNSKEYYIVLSNGDRCRVSRKKVKTLKEILK
ncbi:MAG: LytTR family DNA-binding domain-containing protein [Miniphocaeibacter sp.]|uniref:LytR/AlgR family response regulator transcription factor n=1 Tax=Miniphocaeibacter sp. TaxID=3100973 RepID=UPI0017B3F1B5|nr:response regulator transcription factor [Gallicola sp.]